MVPTSSAEVPIAAESSEGLKSGRRRRPIAALSVLAIGLGVFFAVRIERERGAILPPAPSVDAGLVLGARTVAVLPFANLGLHAQLSARE